MERTDSHPSSLLVRSSALILASSWTPPCARTNVVQHGSKASSSTVARTCEPSVRTASLSSAAAPRRRRHRPRACALVMTMMLVVRSRPPLRGCPPTRPAAGAPSRWGTFRLLPRPQPRLPAWAGRRQRLRTRHESVRCWRHSALMLGGAFDTSDIREAALGKHRSGIEQRQQQTLCGSAGAAASHACCGCHIWGGSPPCFVMP